MASMTHTLAGLNTTSIVRQRNAGVASLAKARRGTRVGARPAQLPVVSRMRPSSGRVSQGFGVQRSQSSDRSSLVCRTTASSGERPLGKQRLIQHKSEAYWFY
eukprot:5103321-Pyramimonas_sp.AAC.2